MEREEKVAPSPEGAGPPAGLESETVGGIGWMASSRITNQTLQFGLAVVFTRLLAPRDFGLVAMAAVFVGLATLLAESGFSAALIQRKTVEDRHLNTVFWVQVGLGIAAGALLTAAAPVVSKFYDEPRLTPIIIVTAANFLLSSVGPVQYAMLNRNMRFGTLFRAELVGIAVSVPVALAMAVLGAGVWSLVVRGLVANLAQSVFLLTVVRWRPTGGPDRQSFTELTTFTRPLLGAHLLNYATRNTDNALIGRFLGATALGVYSRGYGMLLLPSRNITQAVGAVMFTSLARLQGDPARVKRAYLKTISVIALIAMPVMAGLAVVADEFVATAFGSKWAASVPVIRIFCLIGIVESIGTSVGWIYQSQGRTDWLFRWGLGGSAVILTAVGIGVAGGTVQAVATAYAVGILLLTYPAFAIPGRLIGMSFLDVLRAVWGVLLATAVMSAVAWAVGLALPDAPAPVLLLARSSVGLVTYAVLVMVWKPQPFVEVRRIIRERRGARSYPPPPDPPGAELV